MSLDSHKQQVFSSVCRTCLQSSNDLTPVHDTKAAYMLNYCDFCTVAENDGLPDKICLSCFQKLEQCYAFKLLCKKSESSLRKDLKTITNIENEDNFLFCGVKVNVDHSLKNVRECLSQESSLDSNDVKVGLSKTNLEHHFVVETIKPKEISNKFSNSDIHQSNDFISFLDEPLPPPLPHKCQHCNHSFSEETDLKIHQSVHNPDLTCVVCLKKFPGRQTLKRHLKIHLIQKPHVCQICNKSFSESYALTKHLRHHSGIPREKRHFCEECGQGFSEPYYLKVHLRKHTGERPLVCSQCNKSFADPRSFKTHAMIHTGERPFQCNFCSKSFVQNANLTKHLRVHTGEKPYICKLCDKKFSQSSSLEKHLRGHNGEKVYNCDKCDKEYSEKSSLKKHEQTHLQDITETCR